MRKLLPSGRAKQQARLPGRNPALQNITLTREVGAQMGCVYRAARFQRGKNPRWIPHKHRKAVKL
jgi:hypothetical protein